MQIDELANSFCQYVKGWHSPSDASHSAVWSGVPNISSPNTSFPSVSFGMTWFLRTQQQPDLAVSPTGNKENEGAPVPESSGDAQQQMDWQEFLGGVYHLHRCAGVHEVSCSCVMHISGLLGKNCYLENWSDCAPLLQRTSKPKGLCCAQAA